MPNLEIIMAPYDVWWAPEGEAYPDVDESPGGNWVVLGQVDAKRTSEDGVVVNGTQSFETFRVAGLAAPIEVSRTEEDVVVALTIHDMNMENIRLALGNNAITTTTASSGVPGTKELLLERGAGKPTKMAILVRGPSPLFDGGNAHFELPRCYVSSAYEFTYSKNVATGILIELTCLWHSSLGMGQLVQQDAAAT